MIHGLVRNWWVLALRGIIAILFGILTFALPGMTLLYLVILFGVYAFLDGLFNIVSALRHTGGQQPWWVLLIEGLVGIGAGIVAFAWPSITMIILLYVIAGWAIVTGILEIAAGIRLRQHVAQEWMLILMGVVSLLFGGLILTAPAAGALAIAIWIGAYSILFGVLMLGLAFRLRRVGRLSAHGGSPLPQMP